MKETILTAHEAKKLSAENSARMQVIYDVIKHAAQRGVYQTSIDTSMAGTPEIEILRKHGYFANYEWSEDGGGQFILIKW